MNTSRLADPPVNVKLKLSALWASVMFLYIYADYFALYKPHQLEAMQAGRMPGLGMVTQGALLFAAAMMAIPSLLIAFALVLPPAINRWVNVVAGVLYSAIIVVTARHDWAFMQAYGVIEIALTLTVAWLAWRWPREQE